MTKDILNSLLECLKPNQRRGSKPRCHLVTHGEREEVALRLTSLIEPWGKVDVSDYWLPDGFVEVAEATLGTADRLVPDTRVREALLEWWLAVPANANTPNWDIASTCTIRDRKGLLLVEAKAHDKELLKEEVGKRIKADASDNSRLNHEKIGICIAETSDSLSAETGYQWALSLEKNYQMANRFAWSWKLTELGIPVILVYLGFLQAEEMCTSGMTGQMPLASSEEWSALVRGHGNPLVPMEIWDKEMTLHGQPFIPLIRTYYQPLTAIMDDTYV